MKKILLFALALMTASSFAQTKNVSVLENGDFDTNTNGWSLPINDANSAAATLNQASIDGRSAMEITITNAGTSGGEIKLISTSVKLPDSDNTLANEKFSTKLTFDAKFIPDQGVTVPFNTRLWQKSGLGQSATSLDLGDDNNGWVTFSKEVNLGFTNDGTTESRSFFIEMNLGNKGTGKLYFDNVMYEVTNIVDNATTIESVESDIKVWSVNRAINISNKAGVTGRATVYDLGGRQVKQIQISEQLNTFELPHGGLYIVKSEVGSQTFTSKVIIK